MSIFLNENSKVIVQGMTGSEGRKHTQRMLASGTAIVGGVNPKKAGESVDFEGASVPDLLTSPIVPALVMSAGMMPALDRPGLISPGQFGPMIRVEPPWACAQK